MSLLTSISWIWAAMYEANKLWRKRAKQRKPSFVLIHRADRQRWLQNKG